MRLKNFILTLTALALVSSSGCQRQTEQTGSAAAKSTSTENRQPIMVTLPPLPYPDSVPEIYRPFVYTGIDASKVDSIAASLPYQSISMRETGGLGNFGFTEVTFHRNQKAEFVDSTKPPTPPPEVEGAPAPSAIVFKNPTESFEGKVPLASYGRLCYLIDHLKFRSLQTPPPVIDGGFTTITVTTKDGQTAVSDQGNLIEFWAITQAMENIRRQVKWRKVKGKSDEVSKRTP